MTPSQANQTQNGLQGKRLRDAERIDPSKAFELP